MPKEYKSGDMSVITYEDGSFEVWNKDVFITIKKEQLDDYNNCLQMWTNDNIRKMYGKGYGF